jgi:hypothetical protein
LRLRRAGKKTYDERKEIFAVMPHRNEGKTGELDEK